MCHVCSPSCSVCHVCLPSWSMPRSESMTWLTSVPLLPIITFRINLKDASFHISKELCCLILHQTWISRLGLETFSNLWSSGKWKMHFASQKRKVDILTLEQNSPQVLIITGKTLPQVLIIITPKG